MKKMKRTLCVCGHDENEHMPGAGCRMFFSFEGHGMLQKKCACTQYRPHWLRPAMNEPEIKCKCGHYKYNHVLSGPVTGCINCDKGCDRYRPCLVRRFWLLLDSTHKVRGALSNTPPYRLRTMMIKDQRCTWYEAEVLIPTRKVRT